jgi:outer membrane protein assembly factor BamE (lipoprotein component of BamABCDE complex)
LSTRCLLLGPGAYLSQAPSAPHAMSPVVGILLLNLLLATLLALCLAVPVLLGVLLLQLLTPRQSVWNRRAVAGGRRLYLLLCLPGAGAVLSLHLTPAHTVYAPHYTEHHFRQVTAGMTEAQVRALVGEPLSRWEPGASATDAPAYVFVYSKRGDESDYEQRCVRFAQGKVVEIVSQRYYDD